MQRHSLVMKWVIAIVPLVLIAWYTIATLMAPTQQNDVCVLFQEHPTWYWSAQHSEQKWGVPISVQMAIIHRESHFRADAKPRPGKLLGFIPWTRPTTAEGYAQVVDATWQEYLHSTGQRSARRASFAKATDFIGWYVNQMHRRLGIPKTDAEHLYMAYYLGMGGYHAGRYRDNPWLLHVANTVGLQQAKYHQALVSCGPSLPQRPWWRFWG
jgi:hypothetical protein